jgi:diguanylate cyclase (GGDEF)-like protein
MRAWKSLLLGIAASASSALLFGSGFATPTFTTLGTRDGLPNASVSGIAEDAQGFLWFGTQGGLARYDGYSFKLFGHVPFDSASLPHDLVQTLYLDGDLLWAGTYGGLGRLDLQTEGFVTYANDPAKPDSLSNDVVTSIARDARGSLWVGTLSGLNRLDEKTGRFVRFRHEEGRRGSLPCDIVRAIRVDREGRLWVGTSGGGLALFDYAREDFRSYRKAGDSLLSDYVMAIDEDPSGRLWLGTWYGGLSLFDPASGLFENHPSPDERVYSLCASVEGKVYVGTWGGGLFEYDIASGRFARFRSGTSSGSLSNDVVYSMMRDSSGELWIGTNGGGVSRLGTAGRSFESIPAGEGSLPPGKIYSVLIDRLGYLWVSVYNEGLARRDPVTGLWKRYRHRAGARGSLPNDIVNFLREDARGELWAGTNDGLARYDRGSDSFSALKPKPGDPNSLSSEIVFAMLDDPEGGAWIGTFHSGLDHLAGGGSVPSFDHFAYDPGQATSLSDNLVTALAYDAAGRLWVGTNRGLNRLETGGGKPRFVRYIYDAAKPGGVSSDSIKTLFLDSRKVLWVGSAGGGLMRYEPETDSFVNYTRRDGLPSNGILRILEDASGKLWISTQAGIAVYDRSEGRFRHLSLINELRSAEFFSGAFGAADGSLYFGALDKLYRFDPGNYGFNDHKPPVAISSIAARGMPTLGAAAASRLKRLDLSWRQNSVVFDFAALDYRDPERNRYSYRLEGFDAEWSPIGPEHRATYTNLPGGHFIFRVRASNNDGLWNQEGLALPVKVGFAPWSSPWALILYAILLGGGGYFLASLHGRDSLRQARTEADSLLLKLIETSATIESAATIDALTGLPNRIKLQEHLDLAYARAVLMKLELAVVMVDIDHFKPYNDRHGRAAGEVCLRLVADALRGIVKRSSDLVGRYGGEEFLFILEETDIEGALAEGEAARQAVENLGIAREDSRPGPVVTVSVGCAALHPGAGHSPSYLVEAAEKALMASKQRGRNRTSD